MMGRNHVTCGWIGGMLTLPHVPVHGPVTSTAWMVTSAGCTLLPDWDKPGSSVAHMWGPISEGVAHVIGFVAGGRRWGTHDVILGALAFAAVTTAACQHPVGVGVVLAVSIGLILTALGLSGWRRYGPLANLALSVTGSWALTGLADEELRLLPIVVVLGVWLHCAGDFPTEEGLPVPLLWLFDRSYRIAVPLFHTNSRTEAVIGVLLHLTALAIAYQMLTGHSVMHLITTVITALIKHT